MADRHPRVYISGPMTGAPNYNYPAFGAAAQQWRALGWGVVNPAESFGGDASRPRSDYMRTDLEHLLTVDAIAMLPGWQDSAGARLEHAIAGELGLDVLDARSGLPLEPETALQEAQRIVHGDRHEAYGHPSVDFACTGRIWSSILERWLRTHGVSIDVPDLDPRVVALMMCGLKISRELHRPTRDNRVDIAGYAETCEMVAQAQAAGE